MSLKIHPAIATILIAVFIILLFMLIKGCTNSRQAIAENKDLKIKNDSLAAEVIRGKMEIIKNKQDYGTKLEVANGQVELKDNQLAKTGGELDAANKRINALLANHHDINPSTDTSITTVPNEFVIDCNGCFTELLTDQKLIQKYKLETGQLKLAYLNKDNLQANRINQQEQEKSNLAKSLQDCMELSKRAEKAAAPHGALFFSWNVLWNPWPSSAGAGLMYQSKYRVQYGVTWYYGRYGQMIQTQINLPLSIKKRLF